MELGKPAGRLWQRPLIKFGNASIWDRTETLQLLQGLTGFEAGYAGPQPPCPPQKYFNQTALWHNDLGPHRRLVRSSFRRWPLSDHQDKAEDPAYHISACFLSEDHGMDCSGHITRIFLSSLCILPNSDYLVWQIEGPSFQQLPGTVKAKVLLLLAHSQERRLCFCSIPSSLHLYSGWICMFIVPSLHFKIHNLIYIVYICINLIWVLLGTRCA